MEASQTAGLGKEIIKTINIYDQYFAAHCTFDSVERRGARVLLIATSEDRTIRYEAAVSFFPHSDDEDFAVSYDAYAAKELYNAKGRRSKKREMAYLEDIRTYADELAESFGGVTEWGKPLREARYG